MNIKHLSLGILAAATLAFASPTLSQDILIETSFTPVYEKSAPVAAVPGIPGGSAKDYYKPIVATSLDENLNSNQCWTSASMERKTAGTQGPLGVCIWNNGSLATAGGGGRPGIAAIPGIYGQGWVGIDIPSGTPIWDFSHEHDLIHEHECSGMSAPSSC